MADTRRSQSALAALFADNTAGDIDAQDARDSILSSHPEQTVQTGTMASEPASGQLAGDLYLPSDGFYVERYSGSAWAPWGPIFPMTKPVSGDFAWVNQGSASLVTTNGGVALLGVAAAGPAWHIRKKAAPATPYTVTIAFIPRLFQVNYHGVGFVFRESSSGKLETFSIADVTGSGGVTISVDQWTNETSYSSGLVAPNLHVSAFGGLVFFRASDNGTNRLYSISTDGVNFAQIHSVGRTSFLTANEVGFGVKDQNATWATAMTLLSWKEA